MRTPIKAIVPIVQLCVKKVTVMELAKAKIMTNEA
jgi:hypothetical protein